MENVPFIDDLPINSMVIYHFNTGGIVIIPYWLVVWNMNFMTFKYIGNFIIPTDGLIFFRGVGQPPTSDV